MVFAGQSGFTGCGMGCFLSCPITNIMPNCLKYKWKLPETGIFMATE